MTKEILQTANALSIEIRRIDDIIKEITPYLNETTELEIKVKKRLMNFKADDVCTLTFTSDNPLWLAIGSSLIDLKNELQRRFDELSDNSKECDINPIQKTSFWKKVWG